jgi:anti-sigma-K factor RskA
LRKKSKVLENTAALAVTLEPPGGSSTGKPTGPIVYLGKLQL